MRVRGEGGWGRYMERGRGYVERARVGTSFRTWAWWQDGVVR